MTGFLFRKHRTSHRVCLWLSVYTLFLPPVKCGLNLLTPQGHRGGSKRGLTLVLRDHTAWTVRLGEEVAERRGQLSAPEPQEDAVREAWSARTGCQDGAGIQHAWRL